jgi:hypothetical protein
LPFLASVAGAVGLSALLPYSACMVFLVQGFGVLAIVGAFLSFKKHHKVGPLLLTTVSVVALFYAYNVALVAWLLYSGLAGLLIAALWNTVESKGCKQCPAST